MALLKDQDVKGIEDSLKEAEVSMKTAQESIESESERLSQKFVELNSMADEISTNEKIVEVEANNIKAYNDLQDSLNKDIADKKEETKAATEAGNEALVEKLKAETAALQAQLDDVKDKKTVSESNSTAAKEKLEQLNSDYERLKKEISDTQETLKDTTEDLARYTKEFEEYSNSPILAQFEKEKKIRKDHVEKTVRNKSRLTPLLKNVNTGLDDKVEEFTSDTTIFIEDIKAELDIDKGAEDTIKKAIAELNAEYEKKGTEGVFMASKALELSRKSLFDLELAGINKLIKAACYKGETSIEIEQGDITASQIIALNEGGYKVTHKQESDKAKEEIQLIVIDWGFAPQLG